jgi:hypothetical protein
MLTNLLFGHKMMEAVFIEKKVVPKAGLEMGAAFTKKIKKKLQFAAV